LTFLPNDELLKFLNFFNNPELTKEGYEGMHLNKVDQETEKFLMMGVRP
jgi:hypothetical protein